MPFRLFSKKSKKTDKDEGSKENAVSGSTPELSNREALLPQASSPIPIYRPRSRLGPQKMSSSSASLPSISHLSTFSAATQNSAASTTSTNSTKSKWRYSVEQFKGPTKVDPKYKYLSHHGVWAQAYAYGGR